jgi:hypothetical protein
MKKVESLDTQKDEETKIKERWLQEARVQF